MTTRGEDKQMDQARSYLFETVDISAYCNTSVDLTSRLRPRDAETLHLFPGGLQHLRGVPFALVPAFHDKRWIWVSEEVSIAVSAAARFIVFAHACPLAADEPADTPEIAFMDRAGEELARYVIGYTDGSEEVIPIRRRFEVSEWSSNLPPISFNSLSHVQFRETDWAGPHARQGAVGWGPPGSSSMAGFPGVWATNQAGITDDHGPEEPWYSLFVHELTRPDEEITSIRLRPGSAEQATHRVLVGGITLFRGKSSPLRLRPPQTIKVVPNRVSPEEASLDVDLGLIGRRRRVIALPAGEWETSDLRGWGWRSEAEAAFVAEVASAGDASITLGDDTVALARLEEGPVKTSLGRIEVLPTPRRNVKVRIVDDANELPTPARVHFHTDDGRYFPPNGHRVEVNPGLMEDYDASVLLGNTAYAYVDGEFDIALPDTAVRCEVTKGFEYDPVRTTIDAGSSSEVEVRLRRTNDFRSRGWVTADTHVHFVSPTTALLEAEAEGVNLVHILAIQVGNLFTNVADFAASPVVGAGGDTSVWMGSENRQPILGHISLLNTGHPILPLSTGGASTSQLGDPVVQLLADWADRCREQGGFVVASHFPFPYGEITADIVTGKIDAVEIFGFGPDDLNPRIRDWYRFLNTGYRIPIVGGTDKMSAGTPIGAVRTYAHIGHNQVSFASWTDAVKAGRTFISSGPLLEFTVDGVGPGEVLDLPASGGTLTVHVEAVSVSSLKAVEVLVNGEVVARLEASGGERRLKLEEPIHIGQGSWVAVRCTTPHIIWSAFPTAVAAHSSPVYVTCGGRGPWDDGDFNRLRTMLRGGYEWAEKIAVTASEGEQERMVAFFAHAQEVFEAHREAATAK